MNVTFLSDSPLNTTVIDLVGGVHLYNITTKYEYGSPKIRTTTTIRGPHDEVVAVWERAHHRDQDRITYRGKMHTLADWLPRKSALSRCVCARLVLIQFQARCALRLALAVSVKVANARTDVLYVP